MKINLEKCLKNQIKELEILNFILLQISLNHGQWILA
jgi:hypothetical protein